MESTRRLQCILRRHGLSIELKQIFTKDHNKGETQQEAAHYECRMKKPGGEMTITLPVDSLHHRATPWDALFLLAMDASACAMLEGFDAFHQEVEELLGDADEVFQGMNEFKEEYEHKCSQSRRLRDFMGECAYRELRSEAKEWNGLVN